MEKKWFVEAGFKEESSLKAALFQRVDGNPY
jgi:hypothetical protein